MAVPIAKLSFWGVRGSATTVNPATWRCGGNTPCLELISPGGTQFILDCGTGVRMLGRRWAAPNGGQNPAKHNSGTEHNRGDIPEVSLFFAPYRDANAIYIFTFPTQIMSV